MSRVRPRLYPFLMAIIPALHLVASSPGESSLDDLAVVLAVILAGCGMVYGLAALALRGRWGGRLPPPVAAGAVLWFWGYVGVADLVGRRGDVATHAVLLPVGLAASVALLWWMVRRPLVLDRVETFLTLTTAMVCGWSVLSIGTSELRHARVVRESTLVRRLSQPIPVRAGAAVGPKRDIYLIVLDEYANAEITQSRFGFDNRAFLDSLRRLGFTVPVVHSNYLHTVLSIPSLLNASQLADIAVDVGARTVDPTLPFHLLTNNRAVAFLKSQGYRFAFYPSLWWLATRHNPHADVEADGSEGFEVLHELGRTELRRQLRMGSMLDLLHRESVWRTADADHLTRTFAALARVPELPGPVFAFAHVLSPHRPYTFDRECRPLPRVAPGTSSGRQYVGQVECLDRMVLRLVTGLLRDSDVPPIILLQGDHGSDPPTLAGAATADAISPVAAEERLGAFGAYYLPDGGEKEFGDSVTIANVLGDVFRYYFGAQLPRESDDMYLSSYTAPYALKRVSFTWLARADSLSHAEAQAARR